ncbi:MAG TPA: hypothetical protein VIY08_02650 [Candidatus Nitrosocosmicus sp.]
MIFKSKKEINDHKSNNPEINKRLTGIIKTIEEFSNEQREIVDKFKYEMEIFTGERTLDSCLQVLNLSMQLANCREKILQAYKEYSNLLENELKNYQVNRRNL